jgi:hypothetical protein
MAANFCSPIAALISMAVLLGATATVKAAEDYKVTTCPPGKPYCVQVTKPALTPAEVDLVEGRTAVSTSPTEEARKALVRAAAHYRDPASIDLCPPPYYLMSDWDGCRPARGR